MAQLSTKVQQYCANNGVANVDFYDRRSTSG